MKICEDCELEIKECECNKELRDWMDWRYQVDTEFMTQEEDDGQQDLVEFIDRHGSVNTD